MAACLPTPRQSPNFVQQLGPEGESEGGRARQLTATDVTTWCHFDVSLIEVSGVVIATTIVMSGAKEITGMAVQGAMEISDKQESVQRRSRKRYESLQKR